MGYIKKIYRKSGSKYRYYGAGGTVDSKSRNKLKKRWF